MARTAECGGAYVVSVAGIVTGDLTIGAIVAVEGARLCTARNEEERGEEEAECGGAHRRVRANGALVGVLEIHVPNQLDDCVRQIVDAMRQPRF